MILRTLLLLILTSSLIACQNISALQGVNNQDDYGWSPLHIVASNQYIKDDQESADMVNLIIKNGGDVNLIDSMGDTPIIIAVENNKPLTIEALIKAQANINSNAYQARSPLMRAVFLNNFERVTQLLRHEAKTTLITDKGWTALHIASNPEIEENNQSASIITALINAGSNLEATNQERCTPLILATLNNKPTMVKLLLSAKANINARDKNGWTPLMHAVANGNQNLIALLLAHQANIHIKTHEGWSILHMAASPLKSANDTEKSQIVSYLIKAGALVDETNQQGRTPLHLAASVGLIKTVKVLVQSGANIDQGDTYGWTPLMRAVHLKKIESINTLMRLGADINQRDNDEWSALHHAVSPIRKKETQEDKQQREHSAIGIIEQTHNLLSFTKANANNPYIQVILNLINHGANIEAKNKNQRTPLYVAITYQELLPSAALLYLGANVDAYAYNNWTPLYRAISQGSIPLVKLLLKYQANVHHKTDKQGWDALMMTTNDSHKANDSEQAQIVPLLIHAGSHINETSKNGLTATMNASINGKIRVLKALVKNGANLRAINSNEDNKTALDYAIENKHADIELFITTLN